MIKMFTFKIKAMKNLTFHPYNRKKHLGGWGQPKGHYFLVPGTWQMFPGAGRIPTTGIFTPSPFPKKIKTVDVHTLEWFDRTYGNSYFSATVILNFGMKDQYKVLLPFQYGYGSHSESVAFDALKVLGWKAKEGALWSAAKADDIIYRYNKTEGCKKRDLLSI
jgi:hypothetical protein